MSAFIFPNELQEQSPLRLALTQAYRQDETECLQALITAAELPEPVLQSISDTAQMLVTKVREQRIGKGGLDAFMYQYDLSSEEGIALMCLAEAALRVPDSDTRNRLIQDKIASANWESHRGKSDSYFVNAASWALMLTGKIIKPEESSEGFFAPVLKRLLKRTSEPVIRKAVAEAMRIMGSQFVMGRNINEALNRSKSLAKQGYRFSYDMLGEAARTAEDAERYFQSYQQAITAIGKVAKGQSLEQAPGISVKLSALHPRYEFAQREQVLPQLIERLHSLALQAKTAGVGFTVDAEEADRLELSLDIIEKVATSPELKGWDGFGLAVQAYQKRAFYLLDWLADLAKRNQCRLMVRLVKGAYWDTEIKDSQVKGLSSYPVFTRKVNTDLSYLACAKKMIDYGHLFYCQFATHNAYTVAAILTMMGKRRDFEFQCLKGMGNALYDEIVPKDKLGIPCRVYAPVGRHEDLLPYLVRRLLENGANSSFVNRIVDENTPIAELIAHPVIKVKQLKSTPHPRIPLPADIYMPERQNSQGVDFTDHRQLQDLAQAMTLSLNHFWYAMPTCNRKAGPVRELKGGRDVTDPSDRKQVIGTVVHATREDLETSLIRAKLAANSWSHQTVHERAACLDRLAVLVEDNRSELMALLVREAGKTLPDALGEVRETVDYCRYYAACARQHLAPKTLASPTGEFNQLQFHGRGVFLCISPWNFPLAIFSGQVLAALVAGNCVLAKPAEQTSLIAARMVELMHEAGIPTHVVQLLPGKGSVIGAAAVADSRIAGVMFTGSTETARGINQTLANREGPIVPFIAETGGQNAMIADTTALPEQLVMDVVMSAFNSAGQRCSALRVLFLQSETADHVIHMLKGAMAELKIGNPSWLNTDIGPVIDDAARMTLAEHASLMQKEGKLIAEVPLGNQTGQGTFFAPCAFEIPSLSLLTREVFGPILHVIRYKSCDLDKVIHAINATGYGLTLGIHSRINATAEYIQRRTHVGNTYVNRNMIGAVVGVQPFGGEGLSGTGPKAGGPNYLQRLCHERSLAVNTSAAGGNASLMSIGE
ncbi:MAG TPA: bifunctional proline dehydrogenase/L-glutamate gamma-semialdehyde dehydrogenase PutA [Gammaproteobacteria bacterium]|nr:bifunctional proline dehydrogenase/L-glutamate gamma-semialdehyde dehydrogenase PutA [Gammaproteobacteria bacterium]